MKIKRIQAFPLTLQFTDPAYIGGLKICPGVEQKAAEEVFVEIESDDGIIGIGETAPRTFLTGDTQVTTTEMINNYLGPALVGMDPRNLDTVHSKMDYLIPEPFQQAAKTGISVALYDLVGKIFKVPVYVLLGGLYRTEVENEGILTASMRREHVDRLTKGFKTNGFTHVHMAIGNEDRQQDLEMVELCRKNLGDEITLGIDMHGQYSPAEAVKMIHKLEKFDIDYFEQPTNTLEGFLEVKKSTSVPLSVCDTPALPAGLHSMTDAERLAKEPRPGEIWALKITRVGGLNNFRKIVGFAEGVNIRCTNTSSVNESGVLAAAIIHASAALKNCVYTLATMVVENPATGLEFDAGRHVFRVPQKPGLGIELDPKYYKKSLQPMVA